MIHVRLKNLCSRLACLLEPCKSMLISVYANELDHGELIIFTRYLWSTAAFKMFAASVVCSSEVFEDLDGVLWSVALELSHM